MVPPSADGAPHLASDFTVRINGPSLTLNSVA